MEISGHVVLAFVSWLYVCLMSTFIPALLFQMSVEVNTTRPTNANVNHYIEQTITFATVNGYVAMGGRATKPLWIGLCYAPCIFAFSIMPCIDAAVSLYLIQSEILSSSRCASLHRLVKADKDSVLSKVPLPALYVYTGARLAMRATDFNNNKNTDWIAALDFLFVALLILMIHISLTNLALMGLRTGMMLVTQAKAQIINAGIAQRAEYHGLGVTIFAVWCLLFGALAIT